MKKRIIALCALALMLPTLMCPALAEEPRDTATVINYISPDPLNGDNGLPTSPAAPLVHGPINIAVDTDGNAIEAVDEQEIDYFNGYYYIFGQSYADGSFNYAPGTPYSETLDTSVPSFYRWSGVVTYRSTDLENWELVNRWWPQDPETGRHIVVKKPRVVYSEKTGKYVMWFLNNAGVPGDDGVKLFIADSPEGPWGDFQSPTLCEGVTNDDLSHDFQIQVDPATGNAWMVQAASGIHLYKLTPEMTGIESDHTFQIEDGSITGGVNMAISGGIGLFKHGDWWYIAGTPMCGNCIGTQYKYFMAKSPEGPWLSPDTMSSEEPLVPGIISQLTGYSQVHGATFMPNTKGEETVLIWGTHYRSSITGAPLNEKFTVGWFVDSPATDQSGDNNLALTGQWWFAPEFAEDGRILPLEIVPTAEFELASEVTSERAKGYQADLSISRKRMARQEWTVEPGTEIACILPTIFQLTPDESPAKDKLKVQDPLLDMPLEAKLELPNGTAYTWTIDARSIKWAPNKIALNLPEVYTEGGKLVLTLSTKASNGGYGVLLGEGEGAVYSHINGEIKSIYTSAVTFDYEAADKYENSMILLSTSSEKAAAPVITAQPKSVTVAEGTQVGFLVEAEGIGLGYQWYHDGKIVMPHGVTAGIRNESASPALRLAAVTMEDAGEYVAEVFNDAGLVKTEVVTLTVLPAEK